MTGPTCAQGDDWSDASCAIDADKRAATASAATLQPLGSLTDNLSRALVDEEGYVWSAAGEYGSQIHKCVCCMDLVMAAVLVHNLGITGFGC